MKNTLSAQHGVEKTAKHFSIHALLLWAAGGGSAIAQININNPSSGTGKLTATGGGAGAGIGGNYCGACGFKSLQVGDCRLRDAK